MKLKSGIVALFVTTSLLLAACGLRLGDGAENGRILLWHTWQGADAQLLDELILEYSKLHPEVSIIAVPVSPDSIVARFQDRSASGLGPDLLLLDASQVFDLAEAELIEDISSQIELERNPYFPAALTALQDDQRLFGLPFAMHSQVLFYNKERVETPPASLAELQERVATGDSIALDTNLASAIWGVGAFGGSVFDAEGRIALNQGGLVNWLDFLQQAQAFPGFILDNDTNRLRELFVSGQVDYYISSSREVAVLRAALGERALQRATAAAPQETPDGEAPPANPSEPGADILGVSALPAGPNESQPSPILHTEAFVLSSVASPLEQALALDLAQFLANPQQQSRLAIAGIGRLPASTEVRVGRNLPEATVALGRQARRAVAIPYDLRTLWNELVDPAGNFNVDYTRALQGLLPASQFINQSDTLITSALGGEVTEVAPTRLCPANGDGGTYEITIWYALPAGEAAALAAIGEAYAALCPGVELEMTAFEAAEIIDRYVEAAEDGGGPDILLESSRWTSQLAEQGLIADLSEYVQPEDLEPFIPEAANSMRYHGRLYGIPQSVSVLALFYNEALVETPPLSLEELRLQVTPHRRWALPVSFFYVYWGLDPFGGFKFNSEMGQIEEQAGLIPWLEWLRGVQNRPGVDMTADPQEAVDAFASGEAAFLVGGPWILPQLQEALGTDGFGVAVLPSGPLGPSSPMLQVEGVMVNANSRERASDAVAFARYLSLPESQSILLETGTHISASVVADMAERPLLRVFQEQAKLAAVVDENSTFAAMEAFGDEMYANVLLESMDPATAVEQFEAAVQDIGSNGEQ